MVTRRTLRNASATGATTSTSDHLVVPRRRRLAISRPVGLVASTPVVHLPPHEVERLGEVRLDAVGSEVLRGLLDALDLALDVPLFALAEAPANHLDHGDIEARVEVAAGRQIFLVAAVEATVRIEVAAELEDEIEGVARARRQERQALDVGQELEHGGGEVGGGDGVVEVVLQAVEVEVDDGDLAVELGVEGHGTVGGGGVHDLSNGRWDICQLVSTRTRARQLGGRMAYLGAVPSCRSSCAPRRAAAPTARPSSACRRAGSPAAQSSRCRAARPG